MQPSAGMHGLDETEIAAFYPESVHPFIIINP